MEKNCGKLDYHHFMKVALTEAEKAKQEDEVPVGAVVVCNGKIVSKAHNTKNQKNNALFHAETLALLKAQKKLKTWHLEDCTLFTTLEPCPMCAGAIINTRINEVVFGACDPKAGCVASVYKFFEDNKFNHKPKTTCGVLEKECGQILTDYFKQKRKEKKSANKGN